MDYWANLITNNGLLSEVLWVYNMTFNRWLNDKGLGQPSSPCLYWLALGGGHEAGNGQALIIKYYAGKVVVGWWSFDL